MSELMILLYRDWLEFKKKYITYILLWFSLPMILYLFMVIPLNLHIAKVDLMNYKNWASSGIWICSSGILSFIYSHVKLKNLLSHRGYLDKYLKAPISNGQLLLALLIFSVIIGIVQLLISILITSALNNDNFNFIQLFFIFINIISILLFCSISGLLSGIYVRDDFFSASIFFIIFILLSFSFGLLIPINESYNKFAILMGNFPLYQVVLNVQSIYAGGNATILPVVVMNIINVFIFIIVLITSYRKFRK